MAQDENREEMQTFAGHLLAELDAAKDEFRRGRMSEADFRKRIGVIRNRRLSAQKGSFLRSMKQIDLSFSNVMTQAEELRA